MTSVAHYHFIYLALFMVNNRNISFGSNGTYNETVQVKGDFVQGDKIQRDNVIEQDLSRAITSIQQLLYQMQSRYSPTEAQQKTAIELASRAKKDHETKNTLIRLGAYIAANGGIEAGISKVIELALKLLGI
jgi:hypothetical protein